MIGYRKLNAEGLYKQILITNAVSESLLLNLDIRLIYLHSNFNIYQKTQGAVATGDLDPDKFKKYLDRLKELSSGAFRIDTRRRKHKLNYYINLKYFIYTFMPKASTEDLYFRTMILSLGSSVGL
jgi:hypothetical protein